MKKISPNGHEAEPPIFWPPDASSQLIGKDSDAGIDWKRKRGQQRMKWLDGITNSMDMNWANSRWLRDREAWHAVVHGVAESQTQLSSWTTGDTGHHSLNCTSPGICALSPEAPGPHTSWHWSYVLHKCEESCGAWKAKPILKQKWVHSHFSLHYPC